MAQYERTKKITDSAYTPTVATSEANIRLQVDGSISEILDMLFSTEEGKGASQVGVYNSGYTDLQTFVEAVEAAGTGTIPPAGSVTDNMLVDTAGQIKDRVATNTTDIGTNLTSIGTNTTNLDILRKAKLDTGVADAYIVNTEGTFSRVDGNILPFIPSNTNTGASTMNEDGNGVANIKKYVDSAWVALEEGDLNKFQQVLLAWNATESAFQLAPKGGNPIKSWENATQYNNVGLISSAVTDRLTVSGSGWVVAMTARASDNIRLTIDGVVVIGSATQSVATGSTNTRFGIFRFNSSFTFSSTSNFVDVSYLIGDSFSKSKSLLYAVNSGTATTSRVNVTGKGWIYGINCPSVSQSVTLVVDGVNVVSNKSLSSSFPMIVRFESSFELFSNNDLVNINYVLD